LFRQIYGITSFRAFEARIPIEIKRKPWEFKMSVLSTAVVDEGTVDETGVEIYSANKELLADIREVALSLGYQCSEIKKSKGRTFLFRLRPLEKLLRDIKKLAKKYPVLDLAHKQKILEFHVKRRRRRGVTKTKILESLLEGNKTTTHLMYELNIASKRVMRHLKELEVLGLVRRVGENGNSFVWALNKNYDLRDASKAIMDKVLAQIYKQKEKGIKSRVLILKAIKEG